MDHVGVKPTSKSERFACIDTLRGFALLGILVPNVVVFSWPMMAMTDVTVMGDTAANALGHTITSTAFLGKFMFLFAMLFGSGVIMYARKFDTRGDRVLCKRCGYSLEGLGDELACPECNGAERRVRKSKLTDGAGLWYFRCGILLVFGMLHAYGLWFGDILTFYAVAGLTLLWWIRKIPAKWQFWGGLCVYFVSALPLILFTAYGYWAFSEGHVEMDQLSANPEMEIAGYLGGYFDVFKTRVFTVMMMQFLFAPLMMPMLWSIMSMGMGLTRMGVLTGERPLRFYVKTASVCLLIGVTATAIGYSVIEHRFDLLPGFVWQSVAQPIGVPLAFGYGALVIGLSKCSWARIVCAPLAAVGRMALTNYFMHTILCTTFFYGYGFGKYASIDYPRLWLVVFAVWTINIVFSVLWLRVFSMGPFEWLWRSLTYRQLVPIVRKSSGESARSDA
ncbi:MAG: DUF418 domain-containing protein [Phycisphaerales bacterium]|nr:DUF418 domain-containing protein [Phycisphaerales bacterium]